MRYEKASGGERVNKKHKNQYTQHAIQEDKEHVAKDFSHVGGPDICIAVFGQAQEKMKSGMMKGEVTKFTVRIENISSQME